MKHWKRALAVFLTVILLAPAGVSEEAMTEETEMAVSQSIEEAVPEQENLLLGEILESPGISEDETPGNEASLPDEPEAEIPSESEESTTYDAPQMESVQDDAPASKVEELVVTENVTKNANVDDTLHIYVDLPGIQVTSWSTSNKKIATVSYKKSTDSFATVKVVGAGTARLTARLNDKSIKKLVVTLKASDPYVPVSLAFSPKALTLYPGSMLMANDYLSVAPDYIHPSKLVWSSSKTGVASVSVIDGQVQVTAGKAGTAKITASSKNKKVKATLSVTVPANKLTKMNGKPAASDMAALNGGWTLWPVSIEPKGNQLVCEFYLLNGTGEKVKRIENLSIGIAVGVPDNIIASKALNTVTASCGKNASKKLKLKLSLLKDLDGVFLPEHFANGTLYFVLNDTSVTLASSNHDYPFVRSPRLPMGPDIPATDIILSQGAATLAMGQTLLLTASVKPENASIQSVLWSSSDPSIVSVKDGLITALSKGVAVVTASAVDGSGVKARCPVSVFESIIPATGVTLSQSTASLKAGESLTLTAEVAPADATDRSVTWVSSDTSVARVTDGVVTGVGGGVATITAATHNGLTAQCTVTVSAVPVTGLTLNKTTGTVHVGETLNLFAIVEPENATDQTLTWSSSKPKVASVTGGIVTGVSQGTAVITVTANGGSGISDQCEVTVLAPLAPVTGVKISQSSASVMMGSTLQLSATVSPDDASNKNLLWSSDDTSVATVIDGLVTGVGRGTATITAAAADGSGKSDACRVTVNIIPATDIRLSTSAITLDVSERYKLKAAVSPANASYKDVVWSSSDESIASVDEDGEVTGLKDGSAVITATAVDGSGVKAECTVEVRKIAVTGIALNQDTATIGMGGELQLHVIFTPENASDKTVTWVSGNSSVASVTSDGLVKGLAAGDAVITATAQDGGLTASCTVTVTTSAVPVDSVRLDRTEANLKTGDTLTLSPTILPGNATNPTLSWTSDHPEFATVIDGVVTGIAPGTAVITATAADGSGESAHCAVTVFEDIIPVTGITLNLTNTTLGVSENLVLDVTTEPEGATIKFLEWTSSNDQVVTVNQDGLMTALTEGVATVTVVATGEDGSTASADCVITVTSIPIFRITLEEPAQPLTIGSTLQLTPNIQPTNASNKTLTWTSSDANVASVSNGVVTALAGGVTIITATAKDGSNAKASCKLTVVSSTLTSSVTDLTLKVGEKGTITLTYHKSSGSLTGYTSNKKIISASWGKWYGKNIDLTVTALSEGTATVTIRNSADDESYRVHVTVLPADAPDEPEEPAGDGSVTYRALLIGEEAFSPKCTRNRGDVTLMTKMLNSIKGPEGGQYTIDQKFDLDKTGVKNAIATTFSGADENDVSLFFIATHGDTKSTGAHAGELALISSSGNSESYIQMKELAAALQAVPGKIIVIIESCGSGAGVYATDAEQNGLDAVEVFEDDAQSFNASVVKAFASEDAANLLGSIGDIVANTGEFRVENKFYVLTASRYQEESYGTERGPYNYFTRWLTNGIGTSGKMPADTNGDGNGVTTLNELFKYISKVGDNHGFTVSGKTGTYYQHVQVYPVNSSYQLFKR